MFYCYYVYYTVSIQTNGFSMAYSEDRVKRYGLELFWDARASHNNF